MKIRRITYCPTCGTPEEIKGELKSNEFQLTKGNILTLNPK